MRSVVVPLLIVLLGLGVERLLVLSLRELAPRWLRFVVVGSALHAAATIAIVLALPKEDRIGMAGWVKALTTLPATAAMFSIAAVFLGSLVWVPLAIALRRSAASAAPAPAPVLASEAGSAPASGPLLLTRRRVLEAAAIAPPAALLATGPLGLASTELDPSPFVRRLELAWKGLPKALDGLRIVQISDVHVGHYVDASRLADALALVQAESPDLFVVTGDLLDDLDQLDATMAALATVKARHGSFASLGNHEYYTGIGPIRRAFDRSSLHLLVDDAAKVVLPGGASVELSGVDYAFSRRHLARGTIPTSIDDHAETALVTKAKGGDFRLHLSHHPDGFDPAALRGAHLTLSGHTHGGQVGLGSRSLLGPAFKYMRGVYEQGEAKAFVHSGLGHWLPVRLGCPAEIAVITVRAV